MKKRELTMKLKRLALAVQGFRNMPRLGKRKHRKIRRDPAYRELCLAWEDAVDTLDHVGDFFS